MGCAVDRQVETQVAKVGIACSRLPDSRENETTAYEKRVGAWVEARRGSL